MYRRILQLITAAFLLTLATVHNGIGKIPEPDNVIYGAARENSTVIRLKVGSQELASYTMGSNPEAGTNYILRVPMDAENPQAPMTGRPGDTAYIYINNESTPVATVILGDMGTITKLHLATLDSDSDGVIDVVEGENHTNPLVADTDGDGLSDLAETTTDPLLYDTDGDGFSDGYEKAAGTNPKDKNSGPVLYVNGASTASTENGTVTYPFKTISKALGVVKEKYTISVAMGIYRESLTISKNVRLVGASALTTIIDAGGATNAILYSVVAGDPSSIEQLTIRNAATGINCTNSASPLIQNNVISGVSSAGIACGVSSFARIQNNTIAENPNATALSIASSAVVVVNNIVSNNLTGIFCDGFSSLRLDYNNFWGNVYKDDFCEPGLHDTEQAPGFIGISSGDFRLMVGSEAIDSGDPVEMLTTDYDGGKIIRVGETTNIFAGDRIWLTNGTNKETDFVTAVAPTSITVRGGFLHFYSTAQNAFVFTSTSEASREPVVSKGRIDQGAFGNTPDAGGFVVVLAGDIDTDGDIDGKDLAGLAKKLAAGTATSSDVANLANNFGAK